MPTLRDIVYQHVREGELYEKLDRNRVRCYACGHCCPIPDGQPGVCKVRYNQGGTLYVPWGYVGGVQCDPIEKKPFFHAYPGALAYSFGMLGCDLHCGYCQNWVTSQALRDPEAASPPLEASPEGLVQDALRQGAKVLVSTYNEPLITSEWAVTVFKEDKATGLVTAFVSKGKATKQFFHYLRHSRCVRFAVDGDDVSRGYGGNGVLRRVASSQGERSGPWSCRVLGTRFG